MTTTKKTRQWIGVATAFIAYYIVHEGAHLIVAFSLGVFKTVRFLGLGMQIDVFPERMNDYDMGIFCISGALSTLCAAWLLVLLARKIAMWPSLLGKAIMYYLTLTFLLLDPLYLSVLCGFFGGGDMNGIQLLIPEIPARIGFGMLLIVHFIIFIRYIVPIYQKAFKSQQ